MLTRTDSSRERDGSREVVEPLPALASVRPLGVDAVRLRGAVVVVRVAALVKVPDRHAVHLRMKKMRNNTFSV